MKSKGGVLEIISYVCVNVTVRCSNLNIPPISEYQEFLHDKIVKFREKGWTFKQIAKWFRNNGYETVRGKRFYATHVFSIIKNKRLRDLRINAIPEDHFEITSPLRIRYIDRKLINQN